MKNHDKSKTEPIKTIRPPSYQESKTTGENKDVFGTLFTHAPEPVFICQMDGILVDCNKAMVQLLDYPKTNLIGMPFFSKEIFSEKDLARAMNNLDKNREGISTGPDEFTLHTKDRSPVYVETTGHPVFIDDKNLVLGIVRDITQHKNAEKERQLFQAQFRQAQKMEAIGTLTGGIAHEFNNILSPIMILTELTMLDLPDDSPMRRNLEKVLEASTRAKDLINQILTLSRHGEEEPYPLKVGPVVKEALKLLRASLPATIKITPGIHTTSDMILADPTQIYQVLMNLFTNANHAMEKTGGELTVTLDDVLFGWGDLPDYPNLTPGNYLRLTVSDTGHGMDRETLNRIFDPYFTTRKKSQSSGMGLTVAQDIIRNYNGAITVHSKPEKGTTFYVFLPKFQIEPQKEEISAQPFPRGNENILLIDDDIHLMSSLKGALEKLGYKVEGKSSSLDALEAFRTKPHEFDLVLTDQTMPDLTGENLSRELMAIRPGIPIILCTGFSELIDEKKAMAMGIRRFIMKPIKFRYMADAIRKTLDETIKR